MATYRKIHLFDADPPGAVPSRESFLYTAGEQVVTAETEFGRVGLSICYDVRFPELYRNLAVQGATIIFVPAAFRYETGVDHWEVLLRARAIEDQAFVIAAAEWGTWGPAGRERRNFGHSVVADPWGRVIAEAPTASGSPSPSSTCPSSPASARSCPRSATVGSARPADRSCLSDTASSRKSYDPATFGGRLPSPQSRRIGRRRTPNG